MTFLPIVERELKVASRRRGTFRLRLWTAMAAIAVSFMFLPFGGMGVGAALFGTLSWYTFGLCLMAGLVLTSDCLSEERREGTLGLLFLTDLKGYDVVLGKFLGASLNAFYGLLALLPIIGLPLLMGGVTGGEYWRTTLALVNALFVSLAIGTYCSSGCKEAHVSVLRTFLVLLVMTVGAPLAKTTVGVVSDLGAQGCMALSPASAMLNADENLYVVKGAGQYWMALLVSHLSGWIFLAAACWRLPYTWQDKPAKSNLRSTSRAAPTRSSTANAAVRAKRLDRNPVWWLAGKDSNMQPFVWVVAMLGAVVAFLQAWFVLTEGGQTIFNFAFLFWALIGMVIAFDVCRFFTEGRRSGSIELLLCTPLTTRQMIEGQTLALRKAYAWPLGIFLSAEVCFAAVKMFESVENFLRIRGTPLEVTSDLLKQAFVVLSQLYHLSTVITGLLAIVYLGMWLALTIRKPAFAAGWTILFAMILPAVVFCVPDLIVDLIIIFWAKDKLERNLRTALLQQYRPVAEFPQSSKPATPAVAAR